MSYETQNLLFPIARCAKNDLVSQNNFRNARVESVVLVTTELETIFIKQNILTTQGLDKYSIFLNKLYVLLETERKFVHLSVMAAALELEEYVYF